MKPSIPQQSVVKFRSGFEHDVVIDLTKRDPAFRVDQHYEIARIPYAVPAKTATYTPDLYWPDRKLIVEMKGRFKTPAERQKYLHFRKSNPEIEIRFVLQKPGVPIGKGSKTTQEEWLRKNGFEVAFSTVPKEWLS